MTEGVPFLRIVSKWPLPRELKTRAKAFWQSWHIRQSSKLRNDITSLAVCTLYVAGVDKKQQEPNAQDIPTLSQLLTATKTKAQPFDTPCALLIPGPRRSSLSMLSPPGFKETRPHSRLQSIWPCRESVVTFFKSMTLLQEEQRLSSQVKNSVLAVKQKYCITVALFKKFEKIFSKVFHDEALSATANGALSDTDEVSLPNRKHTCWALFILAKATLLKSCTELVLPLQLLLCCVDYIIRQSPVFMLREPYSSTHYSQGTNATETTTSKSASLAALCRESGCGGDIDEVSSVCDNYLTSFLTTIPSDRMTQGLEGLPELEYLQMKYLALYQQAGDIDEMQFLQDTSNLLPAMPSPPPSMENEPESNAVKTTNATETKMAVPMTPVRRAVTTVTALKTLLSGASDTPSSSLSVYFENCTSNPSASIQNRIDRLREAYSRHFTAEMGMQSSDVARSRFQLGVRLYYRVMEAMLKREEQRLSTNDFGSLLNNDLFHRSLLGCSLEVVMVTYGYSSLTPGVTGGTTTQLLFPWILTVFELEAYDFCKVLESFVRDEPNLTKESMKHLQSIETKIVEGLAWQTGSPLFDVVKSLGGNLLMSPTRPPPGTLVASRNGVSISNTTAADMYLSPLRPTKASRTLPHRGDMTPPPSNLANTTTTSSSPHSTSSPSPTQPPYLPRMSRSVSLNTFYNKVLQLAYGRLQSLCRLLRVNSELERYIWTCVQHCVTVKPDLLRDRHLDQLTMCSLYAICKVADNELKFKDIVNVYRTMPHAQSETYKSVRISAERNDSIIAFYNAVFMPEMKHYILRFQPKKPILERFKIEKRKVSSFMGNFINILHTKTPSLSPVPARCQSSVTSPGYKVPIGKNLYISPMKDSPFKSPQPVRGVLSPPGTHITPRKRTMYSFGEGPGSSEKLKEINDHMKVTGSPHNTRSATSKRLKFEDMLDASDEEEDIPVPANTMEGRNSPLDAAVPSTNGLSKSPEPNGNGNHNGAAIIPSLIIQRRISQLSSARQNNNK